ncbi:MAG: response regulator [Oligoflexia bacterium]|nr:response regulator [Oligoflexia bacterium]
MSSESGRQQHLFDLRTLLGNVTAMLELSLSGVAPTEQRDALRSALEEAYRAGEILQKLVDDIKAAEGKSNSVESAEEKAPPKFERAKLKVLVVDDNPINQKLVNHVLSKRNYDVSAAKNGKEALEAVAAKEFDVILMDNSMPVMDGMTATRILRNREQVEGKLRVPIVALTAIDMSEAHALEWAKLIDGYIAKPFQPETLHQSILDSIVRARICDKA